MVTGTSLPVTGTFKQRKVALLISSAKKMENQLISGMSSDPFVHLHCHSHYSLLDGAAQVPKLVDQAKKLGMNPQTLLSRMDKFGIPRPRAMKQSRRG